MLWCFQVEEFLRKEVITYKVSKGRVKIWTQNKDGFTNQHKDHKKGCKNLAMRVRPFELSVKSLLRLFWDQTDEIL